MLLLSSRLYPDRNTREISLNGVLYDPTSALKYASLTTTTLPLLCFHAQFEHGRLITFYITVSNSILNLNPESPFAGTAPFQCQCYSNKAFHKRQFKAKSERPYSFTNAKAPSNSRPQLIKAQRQIATKGNWEQASRVPYFLLTNNFLSHSSRRQRGSIVSARVPLLCSRQTWPAAAGTWLNDGDFTALSAAATG